MNKKPGGKKREETFLQHNQKMDTVRKNVRNHSAKTRHTLTHTHTQTPAEPKAVAKLGIDERMYERRMKLN